MKRQAELDSLPCPLKRHKASSSQTTHETSPGCSSDRIYDVFLNFRGPDSRYTVADVLNRGLTDAGFRVFFDDEEIRKGEVIEGELMGAITNSRIYIPIFSRDYASSKWCLRELEKMIDCWEASSSDMKKVIFPIFYDVDVSEDVKLRSQVYTTALQKHKDKLGEDIVKPWEDALLKVAQIKGWNLKEHGISKLADLIKEQVISKLTTVPSVFDRLVGIDKPAEDILKLLEAPGVRYIVIHGMGGIGKTTLAEAVVEKISSRFQAKCFLNDVRQLSTSDGGMIELQQKLLSDTLGLKSMRVSNIDHGASMINERLSGRNVIIVLDDVEKHDHISKLAANSKWVMPKSKIIITTRNIQFLPNKNDKEYSFYEMEAMDNRHALILFCRHAFKKDHPPPEYHDMSIEMAATTGGLPLALEVIGSSLYNQDEDMWKFTLEKLKEAPHEDVQGKLMISYKALKKEQQQIFLDMACFLNHENTVDLIYFWEACKYYPNSGIKILERRSMIKAYECGTIRMHDQLRDLGRAISQGNVQYLESQSLAKPRRLLYPEVALEVVQKRGVDESVIALNLGALATDCRFVREQFESARDLKFLQLQGGNFVGDFKNVLQGLRWLSWSHCPLTFEVANLSFTNLVILKIFRSQIAEDWSGWDAFMAAKHLKVLHLEDCKHLKRTPNFSTFPKLERLILRECSALEEIDVSINNLEDLNYLEITNSWTVPARPQLIQGSIKDLKSLKLLTIVNAGLKELPSSIGELVHLHLLILSCPQLKTLPDSIGKLALLAELHLSDSGIDKLPDSIGDLKLLKILNLESCHGIKNLPGTIGELESLEELYLSCTNVTELPETIGNLKRLKTIDVSFTPLRMLPEALVKLENLESLRASYCSQMDGELPEEIGSLSRLRTLSFIGLTIKRVPMTINQLSLLQTLELRGIHEPQQLLKLPTSLTSLTATSLPFELNRLPDLSYMTNLVRLRLRYRKDYDWYGASPPCTQIQHMEWLVRLPKLEDLMLVFPDLTSPPVELSSLARLQSLHITCFYPESLTHLPLSLQTLWLDYIKLPINWQHLSRLNNLLTLELNSRWLEEIRVDCLEHLHALGLSSSNLLKRISNLSSLKNLQRLNFNDCPNLVHIEELGELKSLISLHFEFCDSIQQLPDLSRLKKLEDLRFESCNGLRSIPNVDKEAPCLLKLEDYEHFHNFEGPYLEHHSTIIHDC